MSDVFDRDGDAVYGSRRKRKFKKPTHQVPVDPTIEARRLAGLLTLGIHDQRCPVKNGGDCLCGLDEARNAQRAAGLSKTAT